MLLQWITLTFLLLQQVHCYIGYFPQCSRVRQYARTSLPPAYKENDSESHSNIDTRPSRKGVPFVPPLINVETKIANIVPKADIESVHIRHIKVHSEDLAKSCRDMIASGKVRFEELAGTLSVCEVSKEKGGDLGWHYSKDYADAVSGAGMGYRRSDQSLSHSTETQLVPIELINEAFSMGKGDLRVVSSRGVESSPGADSVGAGGGEGGVDGASSRSWHVMQLMDVTAKLSPELKKRWQNKFLFKRGGSKDQRESKGDSSRAETEEGGREMLYTIDTMGCQMNIADSERIEGQLQELGYKKAGPAEKKPDLVVINTCSIRDHAEQKVYSYIGPHALRKRSGEDVVLVVAGCVAQQEGEALTKRFPEVDVVMGPQYANRMGSLLEAVFDGSQVVATEPSYQSEDSIPALRSGRNGVSALVNVIYGCNERCTYCVVPHTRGVEQSRTKEAIVKEVEELVANGFKQVTLLGQNIDSWGRDMSPKQKFADLLTAVGQVPGLKRVRFLTSHPKYMSERVVSAVAANPDVLMPAFNVPFQAGDNDLLRDMRRGYTRERYLQIVRNIRKQLPDASLTADVIVGFPGESEEQFQRTLDLMEEVKFDRLIMAAYSPRPNTPAATWTALQVPDDVKQDRLQRINRLAAVHAMERSERFLGRVEEVLVEDINAKDPLQLVGRNPQGRLVYFRGSFAQLKGEIARVRIVQAKAYSLVGELVDCDQLQLEQ